MALIKCPECGKEIESTEGQCSECGYPISDQSSIKENEESSFIKSLQSVRNMLIVFAVVCFVASIVFFYKGYNVKNEYHNSEYSLLNRNAYVGGDAYNYIINGTYFTGYSVIASATLLSGMILISDSIKITVKIKECE